MQGMCRSIGCSNHTSSKQTDFCDECNHHINRINAAEPEEVPEEARQPEPSTMAQKYPKYYKPVGNLTEVDVYAVHKLFDIQDPSGAIQHASKKLLLSGVRTGGKSPFKDIQEARDTLTRWLQLNDDTQ